VFWRNDGLLKIMHLFWLIYGTNWSIAIEQSWKFQNSNSTWMHMALACSLKLACAGRTLEMEQIELKPWFQSCTFLCAKDQCFQMCLFTSADPSECTHGVNHVNTNFIWASRSILIDFSWVHLFLAIANLKAFTLVHLCMFAKIWTSLLMHLSLANSWSFT